MLWTYARATPMIWYDSDDDDDTAGVGAGDCERKRRKTNKRKTTINRNLLIASLLFNSTSSKVLKKREADN